MIRISLFAFVLCLTTVIGSLYQARQSPFEEFMLVQHDNVGQQRLSAIDPETGTRLTLGDESYQMLQYVGKNDDAIYFIARDKVTEPRKLYRLDRTSMHPQAIITDIASPEFLKFAWKKGKILYVRQTGELAISNLDGTANQNILLPEGVRVWRNAQRAFRTDNADGLIFSGLQGDNADLFRVRIDGSELENITASLGTPHHCREYYEISEITIVQCDDIFFYRRSNQANFYELLPKSVSRNQDLVGWSKDEINIRDGKFGTTYVINLDSPDQTLPYTELDETQPRLWIDDGDWQIMRKQTDSSVELWHVAKDGSEKQLFETEGFPMIMQWMENYHLVIDIDGNAMTSDFYRLSRDGMQVTHLYHVDAYLFDLRFSQPQNMFYFVVGTSALPNPEGYQLKSLNLDGSIRTSIDWESRTRIVGWTDIFVRDWSATKWLIASGLSLGFFLITILHKIKNNASSNQEV